jgi:hypothetical protein
MSRTVCDLTMLRKVSTIDKWEQCGECQVAQLFTCKLQVEVLSLRQDSG